MLVTVSAERATNHGPKTAQRPEAVHDRGRLIAAAHHAISALGIAAGHSVIFPFGGFQKLLESLGVTILEQVAWPLPPEDVVGRGAPRRALVFAVAHEKFEEERRHIE